MPIPDYARQGIKFLEEESPDPQQTGLSWEDAPADLDDDFITPDKIHFDVSAASAVETDETEMLIHTEEIPSDFFEPVFEQAENKESRIFRTNCRRKRFLFLIPKT